MFVGWHTENFPKILDDFSKDILCDKNLLIKTWMENKTICFGAYLDKVLVGMISAFTFKESTLINNFYYNENIDFETKERLLVLLLKNIKNKTNTIMILAKDEEKVLFEKYGFNEFAHFFKAFHGGIGGSTLDTRGDEVSGLNHVENLRINDKNAFHEDRFSYITQIMMKESSLLLSTPNGYQHSYALSKSVIKISPWIMKPTSFSDAHKLLKELLHHRGLKKIISFVPSGVSEITDLYSSCGFDYIQNHTLMYANKRPTINLDMVYGF
jgi:hypothetical protein